MASPSFIATSNNFDYSGTAATVTATEPTGTTTNDILIVNIVLANAATNLAQPVGWGLEHFDWGLISQRTASATYTRWTFWVRRGSSALDLVFRWTSAQNWEWSASCWRGCPNTGNPVESLALNSVSTTGARPDPAAVTTASVDTVVITVCSAWRGFVAPCGAITGYTTAFSGAGGYAHSVQYKAVASSGSNEDPGQVTNAATLDDANEALTFILRSASVTVPTTRPTVVGASATGSTSVAVPWCAVTAGRGVLMFIGTKPDTATIVNPNGALWTLIDETSGGGGTTGADAGPTKLACFLLTANATGSESSTVTVSITGGNSSWGFMIGIDNASGGGFSVAGDGGTDSTTGAAVSVTIGSDIGLQTDDIVVGAMCIPTDVNMPGNKVGVYGVAATGVSSWDLFGEVIEVATTTNNDVGGFAFHGRVLAGTSSAAAVVTATATGTTTNIRGPLILVRVRGLAPAAADIILPRRRQIQDAIGPDLAQRLYKYLESGPAPVLDSPPIKLIRMREELVRWEEVQRNVYGLLQSVDFPPLMPWGNFDGDKLPVDLRVYRRFIPPPDNGVSGSGTMVVASFGATAVGVLMFSGSGGVQVQSFTMSAAGLEAFLGSGSMPLSPFACSSAGSESFNGSATCVVQPFGVSSSGLETFSGSGSPAVQPFGLSGSGLETFSGSGSAPVAPFAMDGVGVHGNNFVGSANLTVASFACSGSGLQIMVGSGSLDVASFSTNGVGTEAFTCAGGSLALAPFGVSGSGIFGNDFVGIGILAVESFDAVADGVQQFLGAGLIAATPFVIAGSGTNSSEGAPSSLSKGPTIKIPVLSGKFRTPASDGTTKVQNISGKFRRSD